VTESKAGFDALDSSAAPDQRIEWLRQADEAQATRDVRSEAMDVYNTTFKKPPTLAEIQLTLSEEEHIAGNLKGVTSWLASGLALQGQQ
jgi:hypothetical protein